MHLLNKLWPGVVCSLMLSKKYLSTTASQKYLHCVFHILYIHRRQSHVWEVYVLSKQLLCRHVCIRNVLSFKVYIRNMFVHSFVSLESLFMTFIIRQLKFCSADHRCSILSMCRLSRSCSWFNTELVEGQVLLSAQNQSIFTASFLSFHFKMITADI